jgi:hypothetical protein
MSAPPESEITIEGSTAIVTEFFGTHAVPRFEFPRPTHLRFAAQATR